MDGRTGKRGKTIDIMTRVPTAPQMRREGGRERAERARGRGEARISTQPGSITVKLRKPRRAGWGTDLKIVVVHA